MLIRILTTYSPVKAHELVAAGCMTLEQLKAPEYMAMLTSAQQRIGVTYFHHLEERVSREEAETVAVSVFRPLVWQS